MISGDAVIHTLQGDKFAIDLLDNDDPTHVFTWDGQRVTVGLIKVGGARLAVPNTVALDDGSSLLVSDDARTFLLDGSETRLADLAPKTSILPLYLKTDGDDYPLYREPGDWNRGALTRKDSSNWRGVRRMVAEWKLGRRCKPGDRTVHVDGNRKDCAPGNLLLEYREPKPRKQKDKYSEAILKAQSILDQYNHKIEDIRADISRYLFPISGIGTYNLAVSGIFISADME